METFETSSNKDRTSLLWKEKDSRSKSKRSWSTLSCILFVILGMVFAVLLSNMDRIVDDVNTKLDGDNTVNTDNEESISYSDIIIVGGGESGLMQAHFLKKIYPENNILLIEQLNRVGGRSFSTTLSYVNAENKIIFEHGAMRFYNTHTLTRKILNYLNLCDRITPFDNTNYGKTTQESIKWFSSRNYYIKRSEIDANYWLNAYHLLPHEAVLVELEPTNPLKAMLNVILDALTTENKKEYPPTTDEGWDEFENEWTLNGMVLNEWSLQLLYRHFNYSHEFQQLIEDIFAEHLMPSYGDGQFFYSFDELMHLSPTQSEQNTVFTLTTGFDSVSQSLKSIFIENGGQILLNNKVTEIEGGSGHQYIVKTDEGGEYRANTVILAIPPEPLQELLPHIPPLKGSEDLINSVYAATIFCKLNLIFNNINIDEKALDEILGSVDLSKDLGSMYVWFGQQEGGLIVIHFYIQTLSSCNYWWNLQELTVSAGSPLYGEEYLDDIFIDDNDDYNDMDILTTDVVQEIYDQFSIFVEEALGIIDIDMPIMGTMQAWGQLIRGSSLYNYKTGVDRNEVLNNINQPNKEENIYIGVSDWSSSGWFVEGAINASIKNMEQTFGIQNVLIDEQQCELPVL